jgi:hypothetical protein
MKLWIVQLERGVWLSPWHGDPGRTTELQHAMRFSTFTAAEDALKQAREYRPFENASILPVPEKRNR